MEIFRGRKLGKIKGFKGSSNQEDNELTIVLLGYKQQTFKLNSWGFRNL